MVFPLPPRKLRVLDSSTVPSGTRRFETFAFALPAASDAPDMLDFLLRLADPSSVGGNILIYAFVITCGLALGRIRLFGVSLGVTFVLFMGLAVGHFGFVPNPTVLGFLRDFGLILFVFFIGLQVGPSFFSSFRAGGLELNGLALFGILLSIALTVALAFAFSGSVDLAQMLGVYYGAVTNTPGLGATQEALKALDYTGPDIAVAYACAYPLAVIGIIGTAILIRKVFSIDLAEEERLWSLHETEQNAAPITFYVEAANGYLEDRTIEVIRKVINRPFVVSRRFNEAEGLVSPGPKTRVHVGDVLRVVAQEENKEAIVAFFGKERTDVDLTSEHSPISSQHILITDPAINGQRIRDLHLANYDGVNVTRVYRAGMEIFPYQNLHLHLGDRLVVVGPERAVKRLAGVLGNQEKKLDHPNIISVFVGIALGILAGSLPIALPGIPVALKLGLAGGPLIVAILLGRYGPSLHLVTYTTNSASLMLRELGIAFFLASVGLAAGNGFADAFVNGSGLLFMGLGFLVTVLPLVAVGVAARLIFRMNYHSIVGLLSGLTTNPPALAYAATLSEKNSSAVAYSTIYPLAMFMRILSGQIVLLLFWSSVAG